MTRALVVVAALAATVVLSGCRLFGPDAPCGDSDGCLPGERCEDNLCRSVDDAGLVQDAGVDDAGPTDAG